MSCDKDCSTNDHQTCAVLQVNDSNDDNELEHIQDDFEPETIDFEEKVDIEDLVLPSNQHSF